MKLVERRAELPAVFVGLHTRMTNISLPQAELKLFLNQHHKVLKDASFFMALTTEGHLTWSRACTLPLPRCSQTSSR